MLREFNKVWYLFSFIALRISIYGSRDTLDIYFSHTYNVSRRYTTYTVVSDNALFRGPLSVSQDFDVCHVSSTITLNFSLDGVGGGKVK